MVYNPMNTLTKAVNMPYNPKDPNNPKLTNLPYNPNDPKPQMSLMSNNATATGGSNVADQIAKLQALKNTNSAAWGGADKATQDRLHQENMGITDQIAGLTGTNKSYDANSGTYNYTVNPQQLPQQAQAVPKYDYAQQIQAIYDARQAQQAAALKAQRDAALGHINLEEQKLAPQYQSLKNQADVGHNAAIAKLKELIANAGLTSSGENITESVALQMARENSINGLNLQEQQQHNDFANRRADLTNPAQEQALMAALDAERAKALLDGNYRADDMNYRDNVFQYQQSQDALGNARADAQLYGNGMPADVQNDLNKALYNKQNWFNVDPQQQKILELENAQIYQRLASKGYDINKINGNVSYQDALKNMSGFQRPTLGQKQLDMGQKQLDWQQGVQFPWQQQTDVWQQQNAQSQIGLANDKWNFEKNVQFPWQQEVTASGLTGMFRGNPTMSKIQSDQDVDYKKWMKERGITEDNGVKATNGYISQAMGKGSRDEAIRYINENANAIVNDGGNITQILNALSSKWANPSNTNKDPYGLGK